MQNHELYHPPIIKKVALLAGGGCLPRQIYDKCKQNSIECKVLCLQEYFSIEEFTDIEHSVVSLYLVSKIVSTLKTWQISHIILAGCVSRTNLPKFLLDIKGAKLLAMLLKRGLSDSTILGTAVEFLENEGFTIIAPHEIFVDMLAQKGCLTKYKAPLTAEQDIAKGVEILKGITRFDMGQALIIQNGLVLGVEAAEGTDALIKRCGKIQQREDTRPILIKMCKSNQDQRVDLPCIGPYTIENLSRYHMSGVAIEAEKTIILDIQKTIEKANEFSIFIYGI